MFAAKKRPLSSLSSREGEVKRLSGKVIFEAENPIKGEDIF